MSDKRHYVMVKPLLETIDYFLNKVYPEHELDYSEFGVYSPTTHEPFFIKDELYLIPEYSLKPVVFNPYANLGIFLNNEVRTLSNRVIYKPKFEKITEIPSSAASVHFLKIATEYILNQELPVQYGFSKFFLELETFFKIHFPIIHTNISAWVGTDEDYLEYAYLKNRNVKETIDVLLDILDKINEFINPNSFKLDNHIYLCHYKNGILVIDDCDDYRILEWEILVNKKEEESNTTIHSLVGEEYKILGELVIDDCLGNLREICRASITF